MRFDYDQKNEKAEARWSEKHTHKSNHDYKSSKNSDPPLTSSSSPSLMPINNCNTVPTVRGDDMTKFIGFLDSEIER